MSEPSFSGEPTSSMRGSGPGDTRSVHLEKDLLGATGPTAAVGVLDNVAAGTADFVDAGEMTFVERSTVRNDNSSNEHGSTSPVLPTPSTIQEGPHRFDALSVLSGIVVGLCVLIVVWKMGAFKLPSQIAYERAAAAGTPAPRLTLFQSILDWLTPWRWGRGDMLKPSTPTGGDMGAHVWTPDFIKRGLISKGRLTGWSDDWFLGIPVINFYFPLPMLTIVALSYLLPYGIAFKIVTVLGLATMPLAAWKAGSAAGLRRPIPMMMSLAGMAFIFSRNFDLPIYGGNVQSTMAGEFSFSISMSAAVLFLGFYTRALKTGKYRGRTAVVLAITGLSHLLPTLWALMVAFFLLLMHTDKARLRFKRPALLVVVLVAFFAIAGTVALVDTKPHAVAIFGILLFALVLFDWFTGAFRLGQLRDALLILGFGGAIAGFWLVPFYFNLPYTNDMGWEKMLKYVANLFPFWPGKDSEGKGLKPYADAGIVAVSMSLALFGALTAWASVVRALKRLATGYTSWSPSVVPLAVIAGAILGTGTMLVRGTSLGIIVGLTTVLVGYIGYAAVGDRSTIGALTVVGATIMATITPVLMVRKSIMTVAIVTIICLAIIAARVGASGEEFDRWPVALSLAIASIAVLFRYSPQFRLWNARALPFWFLSINFLAVFGAFQIPRVIGALVKLYAQPRRPIPNGRVLGAGLAATVAFIGIGLPLNLVPGAVPIPDVKNGRIGVKLAKDSTDSNPGPGWAAYNFAGYEARAWAEYRAFMDEANRIGKTNGCGRALWEYDNDRLNSYGTTLSLMLLPYWTKGCIGSVEGVYFESSATAPFHWLTSAHISAPDTKNADGSKKYSGPSNPQRFLRYPPVGFPVAEFPKYFDTGVKKMQMEGVRYYVALTDLAGETASKHPLLKQVGASGPFRVFEVAGSELVAPLTTQPVVVTGIDQDQDGGWLDVQQEWYYSTGVKYPENIVWRGPKEWQRAKATIKKKVHSYGANTTMENPPRVALKPVKVSNIKRDNVNISFSVDQIGVPVVVKSSYFPNWKATGAKGPYRIMPNFMVVIPTQKNVKLDYGFSGPDRLGYLATVLGLCGAGALRLTRRRDHRIDFSDATTHDPLVPETCLPDNTQNAGGDREGAGLAPAVALSEQRARSDSEMADLNANPNTLGTDTRWEHPQTKPNASDSLPVGAPVGEALPESTLETTGETVGDPLDDPVGPAGDRRVASPTSPAMPTPPTLPTSKSGTGESATSAPTETPTGAGSTRSGGAASSTPTEPDSPDQTRRRRWTDTP
jgi:hypothetical protein